MVHFRSAVPRADRLPVLSAGVYYLAFRIALVVAFAGYAGLLFGLYKAETAPRGVLVAAASLGLIALAGPPYLSADVYSYVADGRLYWVHGLNPTAVPPSALPPEADPIRDFVDRDIVHPYGPGWAVLELAVVGSLLWAGLAGQVMGFKVLAGVSLVRAAVAARGITRRTALAKYADLAFVAVAAHPFLVIEFAGSAHNDAVMMALFAGAVWASVSGRGMLCGLVLGLAAAVKLLPLAAVPWVAVAVWRERGLRRAAATVALAILPLVLLAPVFGGGSRVGEALTRGAMLTSPEAKRQSEAHQAALRDMGLPDPVAAVPAALWRKRVLVAAYLFATALVIAVRRPTVWVDAWVLFAVPLTFLATGRVLPWYLAWVLIPASSGACRFAIPAVAFGSALAMFLAWLYTVPW